MWKESGEQQNLGPICKSLGQDEEAQYGLLSEWTLQFLMPFLLLSWSVFPSTETMEKSLSDRKGPQQKNHFHQSKLVTDI